MVEYCIVESEKVKTQTDDNVINLVLQTLGLGKQVIVFNNSKRSSESTAEKIALSNKAVSNKEELKEISQKILKVLSTPTKQCRRLAKCIESGAAFHHSGLVGRQRDLVEKGFKKGLIRVISSTPTLCLAQGTQVWTNNQSISIEKLKNENVHALKHSNLIQIKPEKIEKNGKVNSLIKIESVSGHEIMTTSNHKFLIKRNSEKKIVPVSEIKTTDLIATVGKIDITEKKVYFSDLIKDNELPFHGKIISKKTYYLVGSMLGDGYSGAEFRVSGEIKYKGSPSIVGVDIEVFENVKKICTDLGISVNEKKNFYDIPQLVLGKNKWFREFLVRAGVELGINKNISEILKSSGKEEISHLVMGLFDTDGYANKKGELGYSSISKRLIKDIQFCLYRFNIVSRIRKKGPKKIKMADKIYDCKESYELIIAENSSIINFRNYIGFKVKRKQEVLNLIVNNINNNTLYKKCNNCKYLLYLDLFSGRTKQQKKWGEIKQKIIQKLSNGPKSSNDLKKEIGSEIRKNSLRLNHHYELIKKNKSGSLEWIWKLNNIGNSIVIHLTKSSFNDIFEKENCLVCNSSLISKTRKTWKSSNKEGDIYWDQIRSIKKVQKEMDVYDVVLPSDGTNDHLFIAEGFITHNSAGLNLPAYKVIIKDYKRYSQRGMADIPILEYHQMSGRAGRPGIETVGKAVLCVKTEEEIDRVVPKYVFGNSEEIISKLAVEPTLKMYVLSLISMDMINTKEEIEKFFASTLYAHQYKDIDALYYNIFRIIEVLKDYNFVNQTDDYYMATQFGKKISELYLNPDTANYFLENLENFVKKFESERVSRYDEFSLVNFLCNTLEMRPLFRVSKTEEEDYVKRAEEIADSLIVKFDPFEMDYENFMNSLKTTDILTDWIKEAPEDYISEKYKITPGELTYKLEVIDWLLYCLEEISYLKKYVYFKNFLNKFRTRFKSGIKEELLPIVSLKGVGRVRARKLYNAGFKKILDLKRAEYASLARVVGDGIAIKIKRQLDDDFERVSEKPVLSKPKEIKFRDVSDEEVDLLVDNYNQFEEEKKEFQQKLTDYF